MRRRARTGRTWLESGRKALLCVAACAALLVGFVGCGSEDSGPASSGTVTIGADVGIGSVDPYKFQTGVETMLFPILWSTLTKWAPDEGLEVQPGLAESWSTSDDSRVYTFKLRPAKFSSGSRLTAEHVVASIKKAIHPKTVFILRTTIPDIVSVTAVDDATVRITLKQPSVRRLLTSLTMVPIVAGPKETEGSTKFPVTSGPFRVKDFQPDDHVTVVRNDNYWGEPAPADRLRIVRAADSTAAVTALRSKDIDILWNVPYGDITSLEGEGVKTVLSKVPALQVVMYGDNQSPPFNDPKARLALAYATDKEKISEVAYAGKVEVSPTNVPFPEDDPMFDSALPDIPFDLDKAKQLFAEAGVTEGSTLTYSTVSGAYKQWLLAGQILQEDLKKIGINLKIETAEFAGWADKFLPIGKKFPELISPNFYSGAASPSYVALWQPGVCPCKFDNAEYTAAAMKADTETDPEKRKQLYHETQRIYQEQMPEVIIGQTSRPLAVNPGVEGIWEDPAAIAHFESASGGSN